MSDIHSRLAALGAGVPEILLPRDGTDFSKWAVIACDQFTQDRDYWERVKAAAGGAPSCINLIFPEVYLEDGGAEERARRIREIRNSMDSYLSNGVFAPPRRCFVYLERSTPRHPMRRGLVLTVDLERYDWAPEARPLIRSTEGTVKERLPPRVEIRRGAPLELPHILLLIDDEDDRLIPSLGEMTRKSAPLYKTTLMMNSGAVSGWALDTEEAWAALAGGLEALAGKAGGRYGAARPGESPFLFAMGDGNHSLATAKAVWEEYKKTHAGEAGLENHPARWALVEVENLYDPGIDFEPIHRVVFGVEPADLLKAFASLGNLRCRQEPQNGRVIRVESLSPEIATAGLQPVLDCLAGQRKGCSIDYIHGEEEVFRLTSDTARQAVGLILPPVRKDGLFRTVAQSGPLPRKSFSMGSAEEKRFYLECRRLF
uniref:Protein UCP033563 n=1 Tax=uncultured bacterium contig00018 TaxID=1181509 RepID=A0A806KK09_9BACT|nr:protein UCP033563 [uncultured bacterium contig00018]